MAATRPRKGQSLKVWETLRLTFGFVGAGRCRFFTSIHESESKSGRLVESPFGKVFKLLGSSVFELAALPACGEPGADSESSESKCERKKCSGKQ